MDINKRLELANANGYQYKEVDEYIVFYLKDKYEDIYEFERHFFKIKGDKLLFDHTMGYYQRYSKKEGFSYEPDVKRSKKHASKVIHMIFGEDN